MAGQRVEKKQSGGRKPLIIAGAVAGLVLAAYLAGHNIVRECMEDEAVRAYLEGALFQEIIPTLSLPREDCEAFARAVEERFANPYIDHRLLDIALNSVLHLSVAAVMTLYCAP